MHTHTRTHAYKQKHTAAKTDRPTLELATCTTHKLKYLNILARKYTNSYKVLHDHPREVNGGLKGTRSHAHGHACIKT